MKRTDIQAFGLWQRLLDKHVPVAFDLEITARCNNACRHCYINLPANDRAAKALELSLDEIMCIGSQAVKMGAVWCLLTGGEPLVRDDFSEIFLGLKKLGLLVNVFTNACAVNAGHLELFQRYPPRDIEVSVYGATRETYERVTRRRGSWDAFNRGLDLLLSGGLKIRLKAMALRSNFHELDKIEAFCRERTKDYYRFDPMLHLRYDGDVRRNEEIRSERLLPAEIVEIEKADPERLEALKRGCADGSLMNYMSEKEACGDLFHCGVGSSSFTVGYDGTFRLCGPLCHRDTTYDLRRGTLREAWEEWIPHVRGLHREKPGLSEQCWRCRIVNLCMWCPAHAALETGDMEEWVQYFCDVAHGRAAALGYAPVKRSEPPDCSK